MNSEELDPLIYRLVRPILFRLDPELAHALSLRLLRLAGGIPPLGALVRAGLAGRASRPVHAFGLKFPNVVGLAAGYDKDGAALRGLPTLGFGHVEIGTVTPEPQPGNPRPRLFRLANEHSMINRLGFPSRGADFVANRLERAGRPAGTVLGINIGKQRDTPVERAAEDYELLMRRFAPLADYLAVNISSPNTPGLRSLQDAERLRPLLQRLAALRADLCRQLGKPLPILIKLSPDLSDDELAGAVEAIEQAGMDGIIASNTTTSRGGVVSALKGETGGLSGAALTERSTNMLRRIVDLTAGRLPVIACGGIMTPADACARLEAGATLVQVFTGLIYAGPTLVCRILQAVDRTG